MWKLFLLSFSSQYNLQLGSWTHSVNSSMFFFFHCYFARTMKSLILFQFRVSLIVLENSFWFCSQDGLPPWGWLTSLMTQKWHLRRQGLGRAVKGLVASGACLTLSLNLVIEISVGSARDTALFWKAPRLEFILVPQLCVALMWPHPCLLQAR